MSSPPKHFLRFFRWFCHEELVKYIEGDLMELYQERLKSSGKRKADLKFIIDVVLLFRPGIIRPSRPYQPLTNYAMFQSYFKIGWRNLLRNGGYSAINIGGLAIGMAVAMLIGLWVNDEFSFNKYHSNYDRIGQIMKGGVHEGIPYTGQHSIQFPLIEELQAKYAGNFKYLVPAEQAHDYILSNGERNISRQGQFAGKGIAEMLTLDMIRGDWNGLADPNSVLLSASAADALFGDADPLGKLIRINNQMDVSVTGVFKDLPNNTKFCDIKFFAPWELYLQHNKWVTEQDWRNHFLHLYCEIGPNTSLEDVNANIRDAELKVIAGMENMEENLVLQPAISVQPMSEWHLFSDYNWPNYGKPSRGPVQFVILIATIGAFVLVLACINFMNLSTARSEKRSREVGIRKSMGSLRGQLIAQFFSESYIVVIVSFILAIALGTVALPWFNTLSAKQLVMPWTNHWFWVAGLAFIFITGLLAGSYPALYLSSFNPVRVLKGTFHPGRLTSLPRKILVVMQFSISVMLIISTLVVYNQIMFAKDRPVGYDREGLIMIEKRSDDFYGKTVQLRNELKKTGMVEEIAESGGQVTSLWSGNEGFTWRGQKEGYDPQFGTLSVSHEYGRTVGWQFIDGRDFSTDLLSDSASIVINESAAAILGLGNPVGETIHWKNRNWNMDRDFRIIGVIKDMVMRSPYEPTEPTIFLIQSWHRYFNVKISPDAGTAEALSKIESVFKKIIPTAPFEYQFADDTYARKFVAEERIAKLTSVFSVLAIFISCLGLFGLASFVAEQRTKELGIRKVLGASVAELWKLLSKDFVVLVLISCLIAIPVSLYFMSDWLTQFQYRTGISWQMVTLVTIGAIAITLATVSYQAIRAAVTNPVKSLKME